MKDIKSLYLAAKNSGKKNDISEYTEAVHEMFENSPNDYISNLEYIIQSDIGIKTFREFVEKHGLPISCYDPVMEHLEACVNRCKKIGVDYSSYQEAVDYMAAFRQKYIGCFMMEAYFNDLCQDKYVKTYYGINEAGVPNRKLMAGLLEKFHEYAIPDIIVTADTIGGTAMDTALAYIESHAALGNPATCEWVLECVKNIVPETNTVRSLMESKASSKILKDLRDRNHQCYREAVISGNDDLMLEYSDSEIDAIHDLISINEYKMTWSDELHESAADIQNTIYSLYEEFDGLVDEDGELLTEAGSRENAAVKKIYSNINHVRKEILKLIKPAVNREVRSHNKDSGFFSKIQYPSISVMFRNKKGNDKTFIKGTIKKNLDDITSNGKKFVDSVHLAIRFEIDTGSASHDKKSINLFMDAMIKALAPLVSEGKISFNKGEHYYVEISYWTIPVYISRECMMDGVDLDFTEAGIDFEEFVADNIIPMLPNASAGVQPMEEKPWLVNTRNKKTGDIPGYIKRNHNLGYGEDDRASSDHGAATDLSSDDTASEPEPTLDDFKRPSAEDMSTPYSGLDEPKEEPSTTSTAPLTPEEKKAINNYYYYTYNNSLNTNKGSFNRDSSSHDDHSTHNITRRNVDDHSTGKRINSDNINSAEEDDNAVEESSKFPWELDIPDGKPDAIMEDVGDADKDRPKSDHPVKDILTDVDRALVKKQQGAKKVVQNVQNVGRALTKPATRTKQWVDNMVHNWKDSDENSAKEKMADPHARSNLFSAIRTAIVGGSLLKAGLLLNPVFLVLSGLRGIGKNKREFRLRNEMIGELKTEMEIIDEKIKDADRVGDNKAKYKLMRFKNELNKKLLRVGGPKGWKKMI